MRFTNTVKMGRKAHKKRWKHLPRFARPKFETFWDMFYRELNKLHTGWERKK